MIVKKYINNESGIEYHPNQIWSKWPDGSDMFVKEAAEQKPHKWEIKEVEVMSDDERQEIFDFAKELMRASSSSKELITANDAIYHAKELYSLKKTI
jgi:hypothetical protein